MPGKRRLDEEAITTEQADEDGMEAADIFDGDVLAPDVPEPAAEDKRYTALEAEVADTRDRLLRSIADMDNVRRRAARDSEDARRFANERLLGDLVPVLDSMALALDAAAQSSDLEALKEGVGLTHRLFQDILARHGLKRIEALGQPFDPNQHEAIAQVPAADDQEPNQVVEELRAGYSLNDRVVRPSLVKIAAG